MYKVWSPYGFNTDFDPFSVVRIHSRGIDSQWSKQANVYSPLLDQFDDYKVQPGHTLIWIAPVAESSRYSCNVNGDGFCKSACENYHQTFLNGHKFSEHEHHDPSIATGRPVASAYNDRMGRIEILVDIDNVKNASIVDSLEKGQQTKWSMACKIDYDVCNVCGNKATKPQGPMPSDTDREALDTPSPGYCKHAREHLGAIYSDGHRVFVDNPHPNFFDISSVGTPAEVIAQTTFFRKAASAKIASGQTGYDLATLIGLNDNERFLASLPASYRKKSNILTKMSAMEKEIPFEVISLKDSCEKEDKEKIKKLKENKKAAYSQLRKNDIILSFEAWATLEGVDSNPAVKEASQKLPKMFTYLKEIYKDGDVLNNGSYDYVESSNNLKVAAIVSDIVPSCSMKSANVKTRMFNFDNKKLRNYNNDSIVSPAAENLLTKYASYVLSELGSKDNTFLNQAINLTLLRNLVEY